MTPLTDQLDHLATDPIPVRRLVPAYAIGALIGVGIALAVVLATLT